MLFTQRMLTEENKCNNFKWIGPRKRPIFLIWDIFKIMLKSAAPKKLISILVVQQITKRVDFYVVSTECALETLNVYKENAVL